MNFLDLEGLEHFWNKCRAEITEEVKKSTLEQTYPVGSIYMTAGSASPAVLFGGTWTRWGSGRVPVSIDTAQTEFNTTEKTGGVKTHTLTAAEMPSHTHSVPNHTHTVGNQNANHTHTFSATTSSSGGHTHTLLTSNNYQSGSSRSGPYNNGTYGTASSAMNTAGAHTHTLSGTSGSQSASHTHSVTNGACTTGAAGSTNAHTNLQPYITCYMWKRTA